MRHWDLTPKEEVTLVREDGKKLRLVFLFRDTARAVFRGIKNFYEFQLAEDGSLTDVPMSTEFIRVLYAKADVVEYNSAVAASIARMQRKRWRIAGERRFTRYDCRAEAWV